MDRMYSKMVSSQPATPVSMSVMVSPGKDIRVHETVDVDAGCDRDLKRVPECVDGGGDLHGGILLFVYPILHCGSL